jgi:hypothetical protein
MKKNESYEIVRQLFLNEAIKQYYNIDEFLKLHVAYYEITGRDLQDDYQEWKNSTLGDS